MVSLFESGWAAKSYPFFLSFRIGILPPNYICVGLTPQIVIDQGRPNLARSQARLEVRIPSGITYGAHAWATVAHGVS